MTIRFSDLQDRLKEATEKKLVFSFGRMNPPTVGHEKLVSVLKRIAKENGADARLYLSHTHEKDKEKNPLTYNEKAKYAAKAFDIFTKSNAKTIIDVAKEIEADGYTEITLVFGEDRDAEMIKLIKKYNGKDYNFNRIDHESAGKRDPKAKGVEGVSGTKLRELAKSGRIEEFKKALASKLSDADKVAIYKKIRKVYSIKENVEFPTIDIREDYLIGNIFNVGDVVYDMNEDIEYEIVEQGPNFVYVKDTESNVHTKWLSDLSERKVAQDKDIDDREGSQPAKYHSGLAKSTKKSRDSHFKKQAEKPDDSPSSYKPAPGDAEAKTKPSVHTKKYQQMFGELSVSEQIEGLKKKSDDSGIPYSILKKVYDRGMAAWKGGHRPGTTPQQWAFARVNSFVTKGKGTWGKADADLAAKVRGEELELDEQDFKPHMMYDPKTGKSYKANKPEDHERMSKLGYTHEPPEDIEEMPRWLLEPLSKVTHPRGYKVAKQILTDILKRKAKEAGGMNKLPHDIAYYAQIVAKQIDGVDARTLAKMVEEVEDYTSDLFLEENDDIEIKDIPDEVVEPEIEKKISDYEELEDFADVYPDKDGDGLPDDQDDDSRINDDAEELPDEDEMLSADYNWEDVEEALTPAQRFKRAQQMRRLKVKIQRMRKIALKRMSSPEKLRKRARRHARNLLRKRFTKGRPYSELNMAQKNQIEKFLNGKKAVIERLTKRLMPKMRKLEMKRISAQRSKKESTEYESSLIESNMFRVGSEKYFEEFRNFREWWSNQELEVSGFDKELIESDIGLFGLYEGQHVPLDCPMIEEEKDVELNSPKRGGSKKFYVYVKNDKGNIVKVSFGDTSGLKAKIDDPEARKSFVARHKCDQQKDKTSAGYWSCRLPYYADQLGMSGGGKFFW